MTTPGYKDQLGGPQGSRYTGTVIHSIHCTGLQMTNRTSMPNIFIRGKSYGGCNDGPGVVTLQNQGKLNPLLKQAGAL